ncbi:S-layer homology domain-containing protein [Paenibacillus ginsengarvi]|uniref:S-layer homology domain-containing protein n=1 Tax=Paenibacillus ginsengarvi TaxID=400777 RepID=UPI0011C4256D|nr:S-layer homology domain-containing protein [Paenibacillus ginsengarvi]
MNVAANPAKAITAFSFATPAVVGMVDEGSGTITVNVPYGTNVTSLTPTITHTGASVSPGSGVVRDFTNPVTYTVTAADNSTKDYIVTVNVAANPAKAITAFSFASPAATGTVNEATYTIAINVPYGTDVTSLKPTIAFTGASISPGSGVARDFTSPVIYTVTAADNSTKDYTVTVNAAANPAKAITAFSFATPAVVGTVDEGSGTITVNVPHGTNVTSLTPTITHTGASISPNSGVARDFTNPVTYTVTAVDNSTKSYSVTVNVASNPAKAITAFSFAAPAVVGTVNEATYTIAINVPYGTDVTSLTPTIAFTGASLSPNSGVAQNFSSPVTYTVTAADNTTQNYVVTVTAAANPAPATPQHLTADRADGQVVLNWDTVTGATYYSVYLSVVQGMFTEPASATVTGATYNMSGLTNGTTYYFIVKAGNSGGLSAASNEAIATPAAAPSAPTHVTAIAGNGQATISFMPPTDNGGYAITQYEVTASSGGIVQNGASSPITVTGLTNGVSYTFTVKAINQVGSSPASAASNAVTPTSSDGGGTNGSSDNSENNSSNDDDNNKKPIASMADILLNHRVVEAGARTTVDRDNAILRIIGDRAKLENRLAEEEQGTIITYQANSSFDRVIAEMDGQWVKSMAKKQAVITLKTDQATYVLPAQQINIEALARQFGESIALQDLKLKIEIHTRAAVNTINEAVSKGMFTLLAPPVEFIIQATYGDAAIQVSKFDTFMEHWIAVPDNVNPSAVTTAVVVESDGNLRNVPLQVILEENRHYAKASSLTSGIFAIVSHSAEFNDVGSHWAEQAINDMGARMIVMGTGDNAFEPDRKVTRAEFAAILVRGLGLPLERGAAPFSDISPAAWFNNVVYTAYTYRLLTGFEDGAFHPADPITREQAMIMLSRAMTLTGLKAKLPGLSADKALLPYTDAVAVSNWALDGIADSIQAGVMQGKSGGKLAPQDFLTRAEAATIMQRLLKLSDLI